MKEKGEMFVMLETPEKKRFLKQSPLTVRDRSLWRGAATSIFALKRGKTFLICNSPFLNNISKPILHFNVTELRKKNQEPVSLNQ